MRACRHITASAASAVSRLHRTSLSLSQHKIGNVAVIACVMALHASGYSGLRTLAIQEAGLTGGLALMALSRLLINSAGNVANEVSVVAMTLVLHDPV